MCIPAFAHAGRMRVANVPVRNRRTAGVQASPKLFAMVDYVERGKTVTPPCARHGKLLAVKRVTSNKGKKTPGVDGILWKGPRAKIQAAYNLQRHGYRAQPLRRIHIPKKNGKMRPLSIPTMYDRAMQALYKLALAPVAETTADRNSYGFREGRSCADAIAAAFNALSKPNSATASTKASSQV